MLGLLFPFGKTSRFMRYSMLPDLCSVWSPKIIASSSPFRALSQRCKNLTRCLLLQRPPFPQFFFALCDETRNRSFAPRNVPAFFKEVRGVTGGVRTRFGRLRTSRCWVFSIHSESCRALSLPCMLSWLIDGCRARSEARMKRLISRKPSTSQSYLYTSWITETLVVVLLKVVYR